MQAQMKLYHYWRSSCSWRIRWALNIKKLDYQLIPVNLLKAEHKTPQYLKLNPSGTVPTLEAGPVKLGDSIAVLEWLEERYPREPLLPQDPHSRAYVRQLTMIIAAFTQPMQNMKSQRYFSNDPQTRVKYAHHWISQGLEAYENLLHLGCPGTFSFGSSVSFADLCLIPQCYNAERFGVSLNRFPLIERINRHCLTLPECVKAHPDQYKKDFP